MSTPTQEQLGQVETEYHRLYRAQPGYAWWRPLLLVFLTGVFVLLSSGIVMALGLAGITAFTGVAMNPLEMEQLFLPDTGRPITLLLALGSTALWIPCVFFAMWCVGIKPVGRASSVAFRLRWGFVGRLILPAVGALLAVQALGLGLDLLFPATGPAVEPVAVDPRTALLSIALILLLVPFQAAAEEYVFRGVLMQVLGSWLRHPAFAILIPTLLFAAMHIYDIWGLLQVALMGLTAAWLAWRTGGLEAAIVIHVVNNVTVFLLMTTGLTGETGMTAEGGNPLSLLITALMLIGYAWWAMRVFRRGGYGRTLLVMPTPAPTFSAGPGAPWSAPQHPIPTAASVDGAAQTQNKDHP